MKGRPNRGPVSQRPHSRKYNFIYLSSHSVTTSRPELLLINKMHMQSLQARDSSNVPSRGHCRALTQSTSARTVKVTLCDRRSPPHVACLSLPASSLIDRQLETQPEYRSDQSGSVCVGVVRGWTDSLIFSFLVFEWIYSKKVRVNLL